MTPKIKYSKDIRWGIKLMCSCANQKQKQKKTKSTKMKYSSLNYFTPILMLKIGFRNRLCITSLNSTDLCCK